MSTEGDRNNGRYVQLPPKRDHASLECNRMPSPATRGSAAASSTRDAGRDNTVTRNFNRDEPVSFLKYWILCLMDFSQSRHQNWSVCMSSNDCYPIFAYVCNRLLSGITFNESPPAGMVLCKPAELMPSLSCQLPLLHSPSPCDERSASFFSWV